MGRTKVDVEGGKTMKEAVQQYVKEKMKDKKWREALMKRILLEASVESPIVKVSSLPSVREYVYLLRYRGSV